MKTTMFKTLGAAVTLAGIIATAGSASAASLSYSNSTQYEKTDIVDSVIGVQKFNSSLGTLKKVTLNFVSDLTGNAKFESENSRSSTVGVNLSGEVTLRENSLGNLFTLSPEKNSSYQVTRYDGIRDFSGTSGRTIGGLSATESQTSVFNTANYLQAFTGPGKINLLFSAFANSFVSGSGNITSQIDTLARASVTVDYEYDPKKVPESSTAIGLGLMAGLGLLSQRKQKRLKTSV